MVNLMRGFAAPPILILVLVLAVIGTGWYIFSNNQSPQPIPSSTEQQVVPTVAAPITIPTDIPSPTPTKKPAPKPTVKPTIKPTSTPAATPTEAPKTGCATYNPGGDLGSLRVTIKPEEGKSLVGDGAVTMKRKYPECQGVDPGFPYTQIIHQGSNSVTFSGMRPGPFQVEVMYHGKTSGSDVNINSGENSTEVTVAD